MVAFRPDDDFEPSRGRPRSLGSYRLSGGVEVYALGICTASVCSPTEMPAHEVVELVNREFPTGISSPWTLSDDETFANGAPNPTACERGPERTHRLLVC